MKKILCLKLKIPHVRTLVLHGLVLRAEAALLMGVFESDTPFGHVNGLGFKYWADFERNPNVIELASWITAMARQLTSLVSLVVS
jgi:hypothetical protein